MNRANFYKFQFGFSMLEVLITIVILAFGLLGLGGLQARIQTTETEAFQRSQAILLLQDMTNRISANRVNAASYLTNGTPLGSTGTSSDSLVTDCSALTGFAKDKCEWGNELKGAAEQKSGNAGAMTGARGCIDQLGTNPPVYRITVAWQGLTLLSAPSLTCGQNSYGSDGYRRAIANQLPIANLCAPGSSPC